ncbi:hypothetical protein T492DRAFT_934422, partial [Pavlovales sp. CCMP2436]
MAAFVIPLLALALTPGTRTGLRRAASPVARVPPRCSLSAAAEVAAVAAAVAEVSEAEVSAAAELSAAGGVSSEAKRGSGRPLTQQFWPTALEHELLRDRPHAIQLLGKRLVLWFEPASAVTADEPEGGNWRCMDDTCAHRFAPLSEGRISNGCLSCAYHGWSYDGDGACVKIPSAESAESAERAKANPKSRVRSYPVKRGAGMLWVWPDSSQDALAAAMAVELPVSQLLSRLVEQKPNIGYMRELPYGAELLGENLLDLAHLPHSHHGLGALNRESAGPVPLRFEMNPEPSSSILKGPAPLLQASVVAPILNDPILKTMVSAAINVELFISPVRPGVSRVFAINTFEGSLLSPTTQKVIPDPQTQPKGVLNRCLFAMRRIATLRFRLKAQAAERLVEDGIVNSHMALSTIFDGDGIFLHKQGERMQAAGLTPADYFTPTSDDMLVRRYRTWLARAVLRTDGEEPTGALMLGRAARALTLCGLSVASFAAGAGGLAGAPILKLAGAISALVGIFAGAAVLKLRQASVKHGLARFTFMDYVHADKN